MSGSARMALAEPDVVHVGQGRAGLYHPAPKAPNRRPFRGTGNPVGSYGACEG
jgi:hypothetical protein